MAGHSSVIVSQIKTEDSGDVSCESTGIYVNSNSAGLANGVAADFSRRVMGPVVGSTESHCQSPNDMALELYTSDVVADQTPSPPLSPESHQQDMFCSSTMPGDGLSLVVSNSEGKSGDPPKRLCLVCGDVASGFHYGVASCEACKAFFKRTIQENYSPHELRLADVEEQIRDFGENVLLGRDKGNIEYTCPCENNCEINKRRRKACQACRYQKCLKMGMLKEGVRLDRVRGGRQKYRRCQDGPYQLPVTQCKKPSLEDNKIITALINCEPEPLHVQPNPALPDSNYRTVSMLSDLVDRELVATIGWAKQIPGFTDLTLNDQMKLLQTTWTEILSLSLAYRSYRLMNGPPKLMFTPDFSMDEQQAAECQASELFSFCVRLVKRLDALNIAKEEYLALKALSLTNADIQLEDSSSVYKLRDAILSGLQDCVAILRTSNCIQHLSQLLLCLPLLRQLDGQVRLFWNGVRREGKVPMKKLFIEMLECDVPLF